MSVLARKAGISVSLASIQLRALNARGLVSARPTGRWVFYSATPNLAVEHAGTIGNAIRERCTAGAENESLIEMATAFTHPRRILVARCLDEGGKAFPELLASTRFSTMALYRHLGKLTTRRMVKQEGRCYYLARPENPLGQTLLAIATA